MKDSNTLRDRASAIASVAPVALLLLLAFTPSLLAGQEVTYWLGEIQSRGARFTTVCIPQCLQAIVRSNRHIAAAEVGVQRRWLSNDYSSVIIGGSLSRRGDYGTTYVDDVFLSVPVMVAIEPLGRASRLGVAVAGGASLDLSLSRASNSVPSVVAATWVSWRLSPSQTLIAGVRGSRATKLHASTLYLRSRTIFLGLETR